MEAETHKSIASGLLESEKKLIKTETYKNNNKIKGVLLVEQDTKSHVWTLSHANYNITLEKVEKVQKQDENFVFHVRHFIVIIRPWTIGG